jgi:hypothetical protein
VLANAAGSGEGVMARPCGAMRFAVALLARQITTLFSSGRRAPARPSDLRAAANLLNRINLICPSGVWLKRLSSLISDFPKNISVPT